MNKFLILNAVSCLLFSVAANADWYEATGQALIKQGDMAQARQMAVDDAVKRAALVAGANINSRQQVINGVLQPEHLGISSNSEIKQLHLMSESQSADMLTVTIRVD
ncbi:flagellar assembly protein T N-terminal domain-containing protein, partial [Rheinheimera baltica]